MSDARQRNSAAASDPTHPKCQVVTIGVMLIVTGGASIIFSSVAIGVVKQVLDEYYYSGRKDQFYYEHFYISYFAHGIWSGLACLLAAISGILSAFIPMRKTVTAFMALCIVVAILQMGQLAISACAVNRLSYRIADFCSDSSVSSSSNTYQIVTASWLCKRTESALAMEALLLTFSVFNAVLSICGAAICCRTRYRARHSGGLPTVFMSQNATPAAKSPPKGNTFAAYYQQQQSVNPHA